MADRHSQYLIHHDGPNCMDVFDDSQLPRIGDCAGGLMVLGMTARRLSRQGSLYLVEIQAEKPVVITESSPDSDCQCTLTICEVNRG